MRLKNNWLVADTLERGCFALVEIFMVVKLHHFYTIKNSFFADFPDSNLKSNKQQKRPFYYCFKDSNGLYWVVPCSSQCAKYDTMIALSLIHI